MQLRMYTAPLMFLVGMMAPIDAQVPRQVESTEPRSYDLHVEAKVGEKVLLVVESKASGEVSASQGETLLLSKSVESDEEMTFVDEFTVLDDDGFEAMRSIVDWQSNEDGKVKDPELVGMQFRLGYREVPTLASADDRIALMQQLNRLVNTVSATSGWVSLPREVRVGDTFDVDFSSIAPLFVDLTEAPRDSRASLTLQGVDDDGKVARLTGAMTMKGNDATEDGLSLEMTFEGDLQVEVDLVGHRLQSVVWTGSALALGDQNGMTIEGKMEFTSKLDVEVGKGAAAAAAKKPRFRDAVCDWREAQLEFELPSHWFRRGIVEDGILWYSSALYDRGDNLWSIQLKSIPAASSKDGVDASEAALKAEYPKAKFKGVTSKIGKGRSMTLELDNGQQIVLDLIAAKGRIVRIRLESSKENMKKAERDLATLRRTIDFIE